MESGKGVGDGVQMVLLAACEWSRATSFTFGVKITTPAATRRPRPWSVASTSFAAASVTRISTVWRMWLNNPSSSAAAPLKHVLRGASPSLVQKRSIISTVACKMASALLLPRSFSSPMTPARVCNFSFAAAKRTKMRLLRSSRIRTMDLAVARKPL